jgi:hypothetical protein
MAVVATGLAEAHTSNPRNDHPPVLDAQRHTRPLFGIERWTDHRKLFDGRLGTQSARRRPLFATHPPTVSPGRGRRGLIGRRVAGSHGEYVAGWSDCRPVKWVNQQVGGYVGSDGRMDS